MTNTEVVTGEVRFSYAFLFKPHAAQVGNEAKYSVTCLLPKSDVATKALIDAAVKEAITAGAQSKWNGVVPPNVATPIHDGDSVKQDGNPYPEDYKGHWVFTISSKADYPPQIVDTNNMPLPETDMYSGCYGRVLFNCYPYFFAGKKGIGFGLKAVLKTRDGEPLAGTVVNTSEAFGLPNNNPFTQQATAPNTGINPITGLPD